MSGPESSPPTLRRNSLLGGRVLIDQPDRGYRAGMDAVLLAASVQARPGAALVDLGCGAGAVLLCALARQPAARALGVELRADAAALAQANVTLNGHDPALVRIVQGDVGALPAVPGLGPDQADHVLINPPYFAAESYNPRAHPTRRASHREDPAVPLATWITSARRVLKTGGSLHIIHRAQRLGQVIAALESGFGSLTVIPLWPRPGVAAKLVVVAAVKNGRGPSVLAPGLALHDADGGYSAAARAVLQDGAPLAPLDGHGPAA